MLAIYKKELRSYFTSMIGYVFIAFFLVIIGLYYYFQNLMSGYARFEYTLVGVAFIAVLLVPILTMRVMAEENKQKTDQLLLTSPLSAASIVMGKFFALLTVYASVMAVTCTYPLILSIYGKVNFASAYAAIFGFTLLGGAYIAVGQYISSLTESQVVAAVVSFILFLFTILMEGFSKMVPSSNQETFKVFIIILALICVVLYLMMRSIAFSGLVFIVVGGALAIAHSIHPTWFDGLLPKIAGWLSVLTRFNSFSIGIFDLTSIVYYISIIFIFTFLTTQVIKKKRWS